MKPWCQITVIAVCAVAAALGTYAVKGPPNRLFHCDPPSLKPDEVCLETIPVGAVVLWVDARPRTEWMKNGVPGSVPWNLTDDQQAFEVEFAQAIQQAFTDGSGTPPRVIVYCGDENCGVSREVAKHIRALDLGVGVAVLRGGWRALHEAGRTRSTPPP